MEIGEVIEAVRGLDTDQFAAALHEGAPDHFTALYNKGFAKAHADAKTKLAGRDEEVEKLRAEIESRDQRLEQLSKDKPDVGQIEGKFQAAIEAKDKALAELKERHQTEIQEAYGQLERVDTGRFQSDLEAALVSRGVDKDYARIKASDPALLQRLVRDEYRITGALQKDGVSHLPVPEGTPLHAVIASEVFEATPSKFIEEQRFRGAGHSGAGNGAARTFSTEAIRNMSDADFEKNLEGILTAANEGRVT